ncbi:MAG: hypothetical protein ACREOC_10690 [Gemmatimonadales bacterium]
MFGFGGLGRRIRGRGRGGSIGSGLRNALLAGAGMLGWRWWKNRQATRHGGDAMDRRDSTDSFGSGGRSGSI